MTKTNQEHALELAGNKFRQTQIYLDAEIKVMENVVDWTLFYDFLRQLPDRVKSVVFSNFERRPDFEKSMEGWDADVKERFFAGRELYLNEVSKYLEFKSREYTPAMGSSWDSFRDCLNGLSKEVLKEI